MCLQLFVTAIIGLATIPTCVAQTWFLSKRVTPLGAEQSEEVEADVEEYAVLEGNKHL